MKTSEANILNNKDERSLLAQLLDESKLYKEGKSFKELLDFINKLSNFAPFNVFLLHIQKPGLRFAASKHDWETKFNRSVKEGARPLLILWPFAPVVLVYDVDDTEGDKLPADVAQAFRATGKMTETQIQGFISKLKKSGIDTQLIEYGDGHAGHIKRPEHDIKINNQSKDSKEKPDYQIRLNKKHDSNVQFATLAHELAHLYLGHLGADKFLKIPGRKIKAPETKELEAESVCYIVCYRNNVHPNSEAYLTEFVDNKLQAEDMDLYALLKAAGQIETILDLVEHTSF
ncbi:MAG: hypothetical protein PHY54_11070 [Methylococcales bacterium]|nr:hypothetical protein [Methylococcales bacterium]